MERQVETKNSDWYAYISHAMSHREKNFSHGQSGRATDESQNGVIAGKKSIKGDAS